MQLVLEAPENHGVLSHPTIEKFTSKSYAIVEARVGKSLTHLLRDAQLRLIAKT